jgi:hypothetical protein
VRLSICMVPLLTVIIDLEFEESFTSFMNVGTFLKYNAAETVLVL